MANSWLRLWHDMPTDPKFGTVARVSGEHITLVLSVYLHLLVDASRNVTRGHVTVTDEDLATALNVTDEQIAKVRAAMEGRLVANGVLLGWDKRQVKREDAGDEETGAKSQAQRKAEQRAREKAARELAESEAMAQGVTPSHAKSRKVTLDKDKDKEEVDKSTSVRPRKKCPSGFVVPADVVEVVATECPLVDIDQQTAIFRDHTFKTARSDWVATWRNWMRTKQERLVEAGHKPGAPKESFAERDERIAAERYREATGQTARTERPMGEVIDITPMRISK